VVRFVKEDMNSFGKSSGQELLVIKKRKTRDDTIYIIKGVMFVYLFVPYGRPNGWADRDQT